MHRVVELLWEGGGIRTAVVPTAARVAQRVSSAVRGISSTASIILLVVVFVVCTSKAVSAFSRVCKAHKTVQYSTGESVLLSTVSTFLLRRIRGRRAALLSDYSVMFAPLVFRIRFLLFERSGTGRCTPAFVHVLIYTEYTYRA